MRLPQGADIHQIAKNCRTSVEMIEKFYAAHIKNALDAAAINVLRPKPKSGKKFARPPSATKTALETAKLLLVSRVLRPLLRAAWHGSPRAAWHWRVFRAEYRNR